MHTAPAAPAPASIPGDPQDPAGVLLPPASAAPAAPAADPVVPAVPALKAPKLDTDAIQRAAAKATTLRERTKLAQRAASLQRRERVPIPAYGLVYEVWPMPMGTRLDLYNRQREGKLPAGEYLFACVLACTRDPETGERVWDDSPEAHADVRDLDPDIFNPLAAAGQRVSALTEEADAAVGNG